MKHIALVLTLLLGLAAAWAQPATAAGDSNSLQPADTSHALTQLPAAVPDTIVVVQQVPASGKTSTASLLVLMAVAVVAIAAIAMALTARKDLLRLQQEAQDALSEAEKRSIKRDEELAQQVSQLSQQQAANHSVSHVAASTAGTAPAAARNQATQSAQRQQRQPQPRVLYLSKPNADGTFTAATPFMQPGNSIYKLVTTDGTSGTFTVIDNANVHSMALMMPTENLTSACSGDGIQMSNGMRHIVTDSPGTARLENGKWHVTAKARIHYEA